MQYINQGVSFIDTALHIARSHLPVVAVVGTTAVYTGIYKRMENALYLFHPRDTHNELVTKVYMYSYDEDAGYGIHEGVNTISGVCESVDTKPKLGRKKIRNFIKAEEYTISYK